MRISGLQKLVCCCLIIVSCTALIFCDKIGASEGLPVITACLGYLFGNGHGIIETKNRRVSD